MRFVKILSVFVLAFVGSILCVRAQYPDFDTYDNGTITIVRYKGSASTVTIPSTLQGLPVTSIGSYAFKNCSNLTSVIIPSSVTNIGNHAFYSCSSMTNVTIPNSVIHIGNYAFDNCIRLPSIVIPSSVTNIEYYPFLNCRSLVSITVEAHNPVYSSIDGVLFNAAQNLLVRYPNAKSGNYTIPDGVIVIEAEAFGECNNLTSVTIPNSVSKIGNAAFADCIRLANVLLPNGITNILDDTFSGCTSLTNITIPDSVTDIGWHTFFNCASLTSVLIPSGITNIGSVTFAGCTSLTSVLIPNGVTSIGSSAFAGCTSLTKITIPNSVTALYNDAFGYCTDLTAVYFLGVPPAVYSSAFTNVNATIYYLPGRAGWGPTLGGLPTKLWNPQIQTNGGSFGIRTNRFGFNIAGMIDIPIVVESSTNLNNPVWSPLQTITITNGLVYFSDPLWTKHPDRFYRLSMP